MGQETIKVKLWQISKTEKAYLFSKTPNGNRELEKIWIPISQIEHISRQPPSPDGSIECVVTMTEWIAEQKGLM